MQITAPILSLVLIVNALGQLRTAQGRKTDSHSRRIVSPKYGFSIAVPPGWFVFGNLGTEDPPVLTSYPPAEALPQWQLPPRGAVIRMLLCPAGGLHPNDPTLYSCEEHQFAVEHAAVTGGEQVPGPPAPDPPTALLGYGEQVPLGTPSQTLRLITVFWRYGDKISARSCPILRGTGTGTTARSS